MPGGSGNLLAITPLLPDPTSACGGYLTAAITAGRRVWILVTAERESIDSAMDFPGAERIVRRKRATGSVPLSGPLTTTIREITAEFAPAEIILPFPGENEGDDRRRTTRVALKSLTDIWRGILLFEKKEAADSPSLVEYPWDGGREDFFPFRPLVSVVVRGDDQLFLHHALSSLIAQEYDQLEILLIWHGAGTPDLTPYYTLDLKLLNGQANRSSNLNLGIEAARGSYIGILDQDDIVYTDHFLLLLGELQARPELDMIYSGCRLVEYERQDEQLRLVGERELFNRRVPPGRLLLGNCIPIHAALYRASVFHVLSFDKTLEAYEDWYFLTRFDKAGFRRNHLDAVTCEYRIYNSACQNSAGLLTHHQLKGYTTWREKVLVRLAADLNGDQLEQLASLVDGLEKEKNELLKQQQEDRQKLDDLRAKHQHQLALESLLNSGLTALGINKSGRAGLATMLGRQLAGDTIFSIILPVYNTPAALLREALDSVAGQSFPGWELCLVDDGSSRQETLEVLTALPLLPEFSGRLNLCTRPQTGGIVAAGNDALTLATAPYLLFLDHDDRLHPEALLTLAIKIREKPWALLYTDHRMVDALGNPLVTCRKPAWSPETLLHLNYINHLTVIRRDIVERLGGLNPTRDGAQDWDLLLRLKQLIDPGEIAHIPQPLYDWRAVETSVCYRPEAKPWVFEAAKAAVADHLSALGLREVMVEANPHGGGVVNHWRSSLPPVEIIIPTHANFAGLRDCLRGILELTDYPEVRVTLVANRVTSPAMGEFIEARESAGTIRVLQDNSPFNWSSINNRAARNGTTPLLLFMNDDIQIMEPHWLRRMVRYLDLSGVGVVGATLFYPNGELQHNGVCTNPEWVAGNITTWGYRRELAQTRNVSAVTGACLLVSRETWQQAGGFDCELPVNYNDIDLCLAVRRIGRRILQAVDVRLTHHEMISRGQPDQPEKRAQWRQDAARMRKKWGDDLQERYMPLHEMSALGTRILRVK